MTINNPELTRNLWLQLSPTRLAAAPAVLGCVFWLAWVGPGSEGWSTVAWTAQVLFFLIATLWGTRRAADTLAEEIAGATWNSQRMSALGAWQLTWGKLLGSTAYVWYAAAICLAVLAVARAAAGEGIGALDLAHELLPAVLAQSVALLAALVLLAKGRLTRRLDVTFAQLAGLIVALIITPFMPMLIAPGSLLEPERYLRITWYGWQFDTGNFALASLAAYAGWAVLGIHRLMRAELQYRNLPWGWAAFVLFALFHVRGLLDDRQLAGTVDIGAWRNLPLLSVTVVGFYLTLFAEPRDPVRYRWAARDLQAGRIIQALSQVPLWLPALVLLAGLAGWLALFGEAPAMTRRAAEIWFLRDPFEYIGAPSGPALLAVPLFALRDLGLVLGLGFGRRRPGGDLAALTYLVVLYLVLTGVFWALGWTAFLPALVPYDSGNPLTTLGLPAIAAVAALAFARRRWRAAIAPAAQA